MFDKPFQDAQNKANFLFIHQNIFTVALKT